jgi:nicotinate-nucleotide adenylyltransferase
MAAPGMRIGLLGGSFDPPHAGHLHISRWALKTFDLQKVWWLVSPGNPLKRRGPAPLSARMATSRALAADPRIAVTDIEARMGTRYTAETLAGIFARYPGVRFVWLMGADNLAQLHHWERWEEIARSIPIGVVLARPGEQLRAGLSPAARRFAAGRLDAGQARALPFLAPPAWTLVTGPMSGHSSTRLRQDNS